MFKCTADDLISAGIKMAKVSVCCKTLLPTKKGRFLNTG